MRRAVNSTQTGAGELSARGPLEGVRVIDISSSYAAPTTSMYLGDMGADVIKIEPPRRGDDARSWGPPFVGEEAAWFLAVNRNKRSVCLDLRSQAGLAVLHRLLQSADVFIENINPAKLGSRGLDPESITGRYPQIVYCAVSGFGLNGVENGLPGYDLIAQARSGLMSVTGPAGGAPERVSTALSDIAAGTIAAFAVAAALYRQQRTGRGDVVDVSLLEAALSFMSPRVASFLAGEAEPRPSGGTDSVLSVYQPFEAADRPIVVAVGNDDMWRRFCATVGLDGMADDPRFATNALRRQHRQEIIAVVRRKLKTRSAADWLDDFGSAQIPCAPIQYLSEVTLDPQIVDREAIVELEHPVAGRFQVVRQPWQLASQNGVQAKAAPVLGVDTVPVLREAGYAEDEIAEMLDGGVAWSQPIVKS